MGEQIDNKRGMNTSREACSSITSTGNSVFCGILVGSLNTDIGFELLATAMERKDMAHGGSLCHPHFKSTPLQDSGRTVSRNEGFSKWG